MRALFLVTAFAACAVAAAAQPAPAGARILRAWQEGQRAAAAAVGAVRAEERMTRTVDGPGQRHDFLTESEVEAGAGEPRRRIRYAEVDGWAVAPERLARIERRLDRSLGPGAAWTRAPAVGDMLRRSVAVGPARSTLHDGRPAWEVEVDAGAGRPARGALGRGTLWFNRAPGDLRLLAARFARPLPAGGHATLDAEFTRAAGLDLPRRLTSDADVRQRRRTRWFAVLVRTEVEYGEWR